MKSVLLPIWPKWCNLIFSGKKTIEIRKTKPKLEPPFKVYVYRTLPKSGDWNEWDGKIIGEFICDFVKDFGFTPYNHGEYAGLPNLYKESCLTFHELYDYIGESYGYGWFITDVKAYEKPVPITSFYKPGAVPIFDADDMICKYCEETDYGKLSSYSTPNGYVSCEGAYCITAYREYLNQEFALKRAPQSWCYVDDYEEEIANES